MRKKLLEDFPYAKRLQEIFADKNNQQISELTGLKYASVSMYMNGEMRPSIEFLVAIAKKGYDVYYILTGEKCCGATSTATPAIARTAASGDNAAINASVDSLLNIVLQNWGKIDSEVKGRIAGITLKAAE